MDPFTIVGLASNVVQFLDFTSKLLSEVHELNKPVSGSHVRISNICDNLNGISSKLTSSCFDANPQNLTSGEKAIVELAASCQSTLKQLLAALHELKRNTTPRKSQCCLQALKRLWKKGKIEELQKKLNTYPEDLAIGLILMLEDEQSTIAQQLRRLRDANMRMELEQTDTLDRLSGDLKRIRKDAMQAKTNSTQGNITFVADQLKGFGDALDNIVGTGRTLTIAQRVLQSLHFRSMEARHSNIDRAHAQTFNWILTRESQTSRSRPAVFFFDWLKSKNGIFWVSGKPGSGKSTLMKHICGQQRTKQILTASAAPHRCMIAKHFFWSSGTTMQKSLKGLLQSLLYDIFRQCPEIIPFTCPNRVHSYRNNIEYDDSWDIVELSNTMQRITYCKDLSAKFCFFIDGLDEYDGPHCEIMKALDNLSNSPSVKICIASRPLKIFEDAYGHDPTRKLCLQDLTRQDIRTYVTHRFDQYSTQVLSIRPDKRFLALSEEVTTKAQGVFLWAFLVMNSLLEGLTAEHSPSLIFSRLQRLPSDLEAFFKHILESVDDSYHEHMSCSFQITLEAPMPLPLMVYSFLNDELVNKDSAMRRPTKGMDDYELASRHEQMQSRLRERTKGLLEAHHIPTATDYLGYRVDFSHRTVRDFLLTHDMQELLASKIRDNFNSKASILRMYLGLLKAMPLKERYSLNRPGSIDQLLEEAFFYAREIELQTGSTCLELIDDFSTVIESFSKEQPDDFTWCWDTSRSDYDGVRDDARQTACGSFLEYAIQKGMRNYVEQKLQLNPLLKLPHNRPMLDCALRICPTTINGEVDLFDIVRYFLEQGHDPNEMFGTCSIWGRYLLQITTGPDQCSHYSTDLRLVQHRHRLIELLLFHGADPNVQLNGMPILGHFLVSICNGKASEEVRCIYLQTWNLFIGAGADLNMTFLEDSSLLSYIYTSAFDESRHNREFPRRIWNAVMPLDRQEEKKLRAKKNTRDRVQFVERTYSERSQQSVNGSVQPRPVLGLSRPSFRTMSSWISFRSS